MIQVQLTHKYRTPLNKIWCSKALIRALVRELKYQYMYTICTHTSTQYMIYAHICSCSLLDLLDSAITKIILCRMVFKSKEKFTSKNDPACSTSSWLESGLFLQYVTYMENFSACHKSSRVLFSNIHQKNPPSISKYQHWYV